jgi:hypothetical protein
LYIIGYATMCIAAMCLLEWAHRREIQLAKHNYETSLGHMIEQIGLLQEENDELSESLALAKQALSDPGLSTDDEALYDGK